MQIRSKDAFGHALMTYFLGESAAYVIEREDGFVEVVSVKKYFDEYVDWSEVERLMPGIVKGRILDVGCGAGRHTLCLQDRGHEVVAIDISSLAVDIVSRRGGRQARPISLNDIVQAQECIFGFFDSVIMMGHNLGLLQNRVQGKRILSGLYSLTSPHAQIIGTSRNPHLTKDANHIKYQQENLKKGRMPGQIHLRIRYKEVVSDWMDYLLLSKVELRWIAEGTGWKIVKTIEGMGEFGGLSYLAILQKDSF